jgi:hypothetical protein
MPCRTVHIVSPALDARRFNQLTLPLYLLMRQLSHTRLLCLPPVASEFCDALATAVSASDFFFRGVFVLDVGGRTPAAAGVLCLLGVACPELAPSLPG